MTARILGKIRVLLGWSRKVPALIFGVKSDHAALVIQVTAFLQDIYYTYKRDASTNASGRGSMNFQEISRKTHYHIRWTRKAKLDWQPFVQVRRLKNVQRNWHSEVKVTPSKNTVKRARNAGA